MVIEYSILDEQRASELLSGISTLRSGAVIWALKYQCTDVFLLYLHPSQLPVELSRMSSGLMDGMYKRLVAS